jgi:hypothetical protein
MFDGEGKGLRRVTAVGDDGERRGTIVAIIDPVRSPGLGRALVEQAQLGCVGLHIGAEHIPFP